MPVSPQSCYLPVGLLLWQVRTQAGSYHTTDEGVSIYGSSLWHMLSLLSPRASVLSGSSV